MWEEDPRKGVYWGDRTSSQEQKSCQPKVILRRLQIPGTFWRSNWGSFQHGDFSLLVSRIQRKTFVRKGSSHGLEATDVISGVSLTHLRPQFLVCGCTYPGLRPVTFSLPSVLRPLVSFSVMLSIHLSSTDFKVPVSSLALSPKYSTRNSGN